MEGQNNHGYEMPEEIRFDDLINSAGWPASADQQYQYQQPPQDPYSPYQPSQISYDHFDLSHQPSYPPVVYANSPYASQYQHARPSDVFGPTSYNVDPSLQSSAGYHGPENTFSFVPPAIENATISPQSLQYGMPSTQSLHRVVSNASFQQTANGNGNSYNQKAQDQSTVYYPEAQNGITQSSQGNSVPYPVLPNGAPEHELKQSVKRYVNADAASSAPRTQPGKSAPSQNLLRMTHPDLYASEHPSSRPRFEYAPFLTWEDEPMQITLGLKNTLPKYHPRKSRSGRELVPGFNLSHSLTPARISTKKGRPPKETKPLLSKLKAISKGVKPVNEKINNLRDESLLTSVKSPSTPTETSSSEEDSSSEEESEYDEDEDMPVMDISEVRGPTRPTDVSAAARWDAIGIIWKDPGSSPSADVVKDAIEKYGNFVSALRVQLKTNSTKTEEAAGRTAEVERLKNDRKVLLESLYQTIDAANQHGYGAIVENLGGHHKLVNGLTTTLIECIKADDLLGKLPKAVFSLLAKFQTMTDELLKKLKFDSIQKRWNKRGDDETKKYITTILANTTDARERATKAKKDSDGVEEEKKIKEKVDQNKSRNAESSNPTLSNPAKRPHDGDGINGKPAKKFASDNAGTPASSKAIPMKRTVTNLLGIASKPVAKPVSKKLEPPPQTESKLGALLASIAKDPEPPKAPEAPPRPPETPEEKARRERKESRRHLRVKFKEGTDLEDIRLFKHEQAEDEGRQDEMLRDAHDDRLEGMMHKKRVSELMDDDEDYQPAEPEGPYNEPIRIDFSPLQKSSRFGASYATRGGDLTFKTPEQKIQERREGLELMVIYTNPNDIPSSPKELSHPDMPGSTQREHQLKDPAEPWLVQRLQEIHHYGPEHALQIFQSRQEEQMVKELRDLGASQPFPANSAPSTDVSSILQQLGGSTSQQSPYSQLPQTKNLPVTMEPQQLANLERLVNSLRSKSYPPTEPPDWMTNSVQRAEWIAGYERDKAAKEKREADERIAQMQAAQYQPPAMLPPQFQQQFPTPQVTFPPPMPPPTNPANPQLSDITHQVQSYLAGYQLNENKAAPLQQFDYNNWAGQQPAEQIQSYANQNQQPRWDGSWNSENSKPNRSQENANPKGKQRNFESKPPNDSIFDERGEYKGKKKPCRFYREGKCAKGDKCTFLHD